MLMIGTIQNLQTTSNCIVYNFSSLNEKYVRLNLFPPNNLGAMDEYDFDIKYAIYILGNDAIFFDMMRIVYSLYQGKDVFVLIDDTEQFEMYNESLMKFIQQRYGYNFNLIQSFDDFINAEESRFSELGIINLAQDKERLSYMLEAERIKNGGTPYTIV